MLNTIGRFAYIYSKNKAVKQCNYEKMNHDNKRLFKLTSFVIDQLTKNKFFFGESIY